jgi:hypothetical protein
MEDAGENGSEELLLNILSLLAHQQLPAQATGVVSWLSHQLASSGQASSDEWSSSLKEISSLLSSIRPWDLHAISVQAIVFSYGSSTHVYLCTLLCTHALHSCPPRLEERWKRWRSLLCETIALYQRHVTEKEYVEEEALVLWLDHVLPACQRVESALPAHVNRIPLMAGMVGTTTRLAQSSPERQRLLHSLQPHDELVWCHPWRMAMQHCCSTNENHVACSEQLWWWSMHAACHDAVTGMDTWWDPVGIALLSFEGFDKRPLVYSFQYMWQLWFPQTSTLLNTTQDAFVLRVLQSLLSNLPEESLEYNEEGPLSPIGALQLLMNRIMTDNKSIVPIIQTLLSPYLPEHQVSIMKTLVNTCPHPGLIPRHLDLLRPLAKRKEKSPLLCYLMTFWENLVSNHMDKQATTTCKCTRIVGSSGGVRFGALFDSTASEFNGGTGTASGISCGLDECLGGMEQEWHAS